MSLVNDLCLLYCPRMDDAFTEDTPVQIRLGTPLYSSVEPFPADVGSFSFTVLN
jgi:hypothetical protein